MCDYVSFLATTEGPFQLYAAPGLSSHGEARAGWGIVDGAECEWTGEHHESLTVRYADKKIADTIRLMLVERFPNRTALLAAITETRGEGGTRAWYENGQRVFREEDAGPSHQEINDLIRRLPTFPWCKPAAELDNETIAQLVSTHLHELATYTKSPDAFKGMRLKIVATAEDVAAARDAARTAARAAARTAARDAAWAAARAAAHLVAAIPHNPWAPLVEIMALGCIPIGVIGDEFVVWRPSCCA